MKINDAGINLANRIAYNILKTTMRAEDSMQIMMIVVY